MKGSRLKSGNSFSDIFSAVIITAVFLILVALIMTFKANGVWGSQTDWINQHFALPEYFRRRFYETGDIFPDFAAQLGGGQNIYSMSYYGLMNPVYLPSYLLPHVKMADYIQAVSLISVLVSSICCCGFMKKHFSVRMSLVLSLMFLCSAPILFHSHRHIMFVNYFPFLFAALSAAGKEDSAGSRAVLIISSYCILCSSFYFSISCFAAVVLYAAFTELRNDGNLKIKELIKRISGKISAVVLGCLAAGLLWLPTFFTLLSGREKCSVNINIIKLMVPNVNLGYMLYGSYSMGLTAVSAAALIGTLLYGDKALKLISGVIAAFICCPVIIYLINGTMYLDSKVLIPFIPIALLITGEFVKIIMSGKLNPMIVTAIFTAVTVLDAIFNERKKYMHVFLLIDCIIVIVSVLLCAKKKKMNVILIPALICAIINCVTVNFSEKFVPKQTVEAAYSEDICSLTDKAAAYDTSFYRFANDIETSKTVNCIYGSGYYSANYYSSVTNPYYRNFRFNESAGENSFRSNAIQTQPHNIIFNVLMGCRYRISTDRDAMYGEVKISDSDEFALYKNDNALPVGYASASLMSEGEFNSLNFAEKAEALLGNIIVPEASSAKENFPKTEKMNCGYTVSGDTSAITEKDGVYEINSENDFTLTAHLDKPVIGKLIMIGFRADNRIGGESQRSEVWVTVNGVTNLLSAPEWKYNNKNYDFTYVLSSDKPITELEFVFSKGNYVIADSEAYTIDASALGSASVGKDEFVIDRETMGGDTIEGSITVTENGWFNISVPYDDNFEILVDGVEREYYLTNTAFIGFPIEKGNHYISITYKAPYKTAAVLMTVSGIGMSIFMLIGMSESKIRRRAYGRSGWRKKSRTAAELSNR